MEGMLQIVMLKKLNRLAHIRCKKVRDGTNEVIDALCCYIYISGAKWLESLT